MNRRRSLKLHVLSSDTACKCLVLTIGDVRILLDPAVELGTLAAQRPVSVSSSAAVSAGRADKRQRVHHKPSSYSGQRLRAAQTFHFRLSPASRVQLETPHLDACDLSTVDVVLVSNHLTILGLPYITARAEFSGQV